MLFEYVNSAEVARKYVMGADGALWTLERGIALSPQGQSAGQSIAISGSSQQSSAITETQVDLMADTACSIAIGTNPTAVIATSYRLPANTLVRLGLVSGSKIAVIGTSGTLYISPVGEAA